MFFVFFLLVVGVRRVFIVFWSLVVVLGFIRRNFGIFSAESRSFVLCVGGIFGWLEVWGVGMRGYKTGRFRSVFGGRSCFFIFFFEN